MNELAIYLIRASICMSLLFMVYWLFLRRETLFSVNRYYLLSALLLSMLLPMARIKYPVALPADLAPGDLSESLQVLPILQQGGGFLSGAAAYLPLIYLIGVVLFFLRIAWQFIVLFILIRKNGIRDIGGVRVVHNRRYSLPFSFMNLVFMNPESIREGEVSDIIAHEKVHIRENHWFDLLIVELMSIFLWFNPFIWFYERAIKQNHEYLADKGVVAQGFNVSRYHSVLLNQLMGMEVIGITNNLNYSLNAKRLKMMNKKITPRAKAVHLVWALPVVLLLLAAFAQPEYQTIADDVEVRVAEEISLTALVLDPDGKPVAGAKVYIKGTKTGTKTNSDGEFTLKVGSSDFVIISSKGYKDEVIPMEKLIAKKGDSDKIKFKVKLEAAGKVASSDMTVDQQIEELEMILKKLKVKEKELDKQKAKLAKVEEEGSVDQEVLDKKKANLKKEYVAVKEKTKKVEMKLKSLKEKKAS